MSELVSTSSVPDHTIEDYKEHFEKMHRIANPDKHWDDLNIYVRRMVSQYEEEYRSHSGDSIDLEGSMYYIESHDISFRGKSFAKEDLIVIDDRKKTHRLCLTDKSSVITDNETHETEIRTYGFSVAHKACEYFPEEPACENAGFLAFSLAYCVTMIIFLHKADSLTTKFASSISAGVWTSIFETNDCEREHAKMLGLIDLELESNNI